MDKGAELIEDGKALMGNAKRRRQTTTWGVKKN